MQIIVDAFRICKAEHNWIKPMFFHRFSEKSDWKPSIWVQTQWLATRSASIWKVTLALWPEASAQQ